MGIVPVVGSAEIVTRGVGASFKKENRRFACGVGESMGEETA